MMTQPQLYTCAECKTDAWCSADTTDASHPNCAQCGRPMQMVVGVPAVLAPDPDPTPTPASDMLTVYLTAPLPEDVLEKTKNPKNLFGKHVLLGELGRGGTGTVVKAWDTYLSRHVALKFLHATAPEGVEMDATERVQEFLREARIAARVRHPNIVRIHEVDCRDGRYYISMDFIGGGTLAELIHGTGARSRTLFYRDPDRLLSMLRSIALAVHHAHSQKPPVVHRDLKPQNVLIDALGHPCVADFGLANEIRVETGVGVAGGIRGTPAYMAPEQALGQTGEIDPRTDVYSLGVILYEMLTGTTPFKGSNVPAILRKIVTDAPAPPSDSFDDLRRILPEFKSVPVDMLADLQAICLKALSKNRQHRYASALEFADAVGQWIAPEAAEPTARSTKIRTNLRKRRVRVFAVVMALLLGVLATQSHRLRIPAAAQAGDDVATVASGLLSAGQWTAFEGAVTELKNRAPSHPSLIGFERALEEHHTLLSRRRDLWTEKLDRLGSGADRFVADDIRRALQASGELEEEFRGSLRRAMARLQSGLLERARDCAGSRDRWLDEETKHRAAELRERISDLTSLADDPDFDVETRPLAEAAELLGRVIAYRGAWSARINVNPFAEFLILDDGREVARDFTPSSFKRLDVGSGDTTVELCWPSRKDPKVRWSGRISGLRAGETVIISGDLEKSQIQIDRK